MEEQWLWYLAGSVDTAMNIGVKVQKDERLALDYTMTPILTYTRPVEVESVFGMLDEYCEEFDVRYRREEFESSTRLVIESPENIKRFLEPLLPGIVQQRERVEVMLEEFLPLVMDGRPTDEEPFIEAMEIADKMDQHPIHSYESKYDAEFFKNEWR